MVVLNNKELLKKLNILLAYARVSTEEQAGTLKDQRSAIERSLKNEGYKGKIEFFEEQVSGTKLDREEFQKMIEKAKELKEKGKKVGIVVRDIQRFARHPYFFGFFMTELYLLNIPVIALNDNQHSGTFSEPNPTGELLLTILATVGGQEVSIRKQQTLQGVAESRAKGIVSGSIIDVYPEDKLNPFREVWRQLQAGIGQSEGSRRVGRSSSWWRKTRDRLLDIHTKGGDEKLEEYIERTEMIRKFEQKHGKGIGPKAKQPNKIVRRMTSGYLQSPFEFDVWNQEDIDEYFQNWKQYRPKRSK